MSLADAVLGLKLENILAQINLSDEVKDAVLKHEGLFGPMLNTGATTGNRSV
jgi:c-di-GMP-related signal transduction protein